MLVAHAVLRGGARAALFVVVVVVHVMHIFFYFYDNNGPVNNIFLNRAVSEPGRSRLSIVTRGLKKKSGPGSSANRRSARLGMCSSVRLPVVFPTRRSRH